LELLIAITIFAILAAFAYTGLKVVLDTGAQTSRRIEYLGRLQIALNLMQRDIEQAVPRGIRDEFGDPQPALLSGSGPGILFEFTRQGRPNPLHLARSDLQRVGYQLSEDPAVDGETRTLYRLSWPVLDRAQGSQPRRSTLVDGIKGIEVHYLDQRMKPQSTWPKPNDSKPPGYALPKAMELIMDIEGLGKIRRLFRMAEAPLGSGG